MEFAGTALGIDGDALTLSNISTDEAQGEKA
jgi:hypothetical protein